MRALERKNDYKSLSVIQHKSIGVRINVLAANCSGVQNKIEASQQNRPFSDRNNILTCEAAVMRPAVTPPPGTTNAGRSSNESIKLLVLTNICKINNGLQIFLTTY